MQSDVKDSTCHVYRLSPVRLWVLPGIYGLFALVFAAVLFIPAKAPATKGDIAICGLLLGFLFVILAPLFILVWRSRLVLTPDGIAHFQAGYAVRSTWLNLCALSLRPGQESLHLAEPGTRSKLLRISTNIIAALAPGVARGIGGDPKALAEGRLIVLTPFMAHWKRGTLREDLHRWAPHLFNESGRAHTF